MVVQFVRFEVFGLVKLGWQIVLKAASFALSISDGFSVAFFLRLQDVSYVWTRL